MKKHWQHRGKFEYETKFSGWNSGRNNSFDTAEGDSFEEREVYIIDEETMNKIISTLEWYRDESQATTRAVASKNPDAMMASLTIHSLEGGRRAAELLEKLNAE